MESFAIVLLLVVAGGFLIYANGKDKPISRPTRRTSDSQKSGVREIRPAPRRFDPKTAKHQNIAKVIEGPAYVIDGDSIVIQKTQVRIFGVDAPELNHPYGKKAKWAMVSMCKGHKVRAEVTEIDAYGRTVAKCYLPDGRDLSAEMVKQGLALDWPKFSGGKYRSIETPDARKKLWLADARQKGRMHVWQKFDYDQYRARAAKD